jgi:hypothetical protein
MAAAIRRTVKSAFDSASGLSGPRVGGPLSRRSHRGQFRIDVAGFYPGQFVEGRLVASPSIELFTDVERDASIADESRVAEVIGTPGPILSFPVHRITPFKRIRSIAQEARFCSVQFSPGNFTIARPQTVHSLTKRPFSQWLVLKLAAWLPNRS